KKRGADVFAFARKAFAVHSLGAVARLVRIARTVMSNLSKVTCPTLILQDPYDHHVGSEVPAYLASKVSSGTVLTQWFPHGQHELTIGPHHQEVFETIGAFLMGHAQPAAEKN